MTVPGLALIIANFTAVGLLPRIFFRQDGRRLGLMWWVTALPFFLCPGVVVGAHVTGLGPAVPDGWTGPLAVVSVVLSATSIALLFTTIGTHRIPISLWHQEDDAPQSIVTYGPYSRIRHPFYTSFLLAFLAALTLFPHWVVLVLATYAFVALNHTADREERRLSASDFGAEYRAYMARTHRFLPLPAPRRVPPARSTAVGGPTPPTHD